MVELIAEKQDLSSKVKEVDNAISELDGMSRSLEIEANNRQTRIESRYSELQKQVKGVFEDFSARITSGRIFTDVIFDSVISSYKAGFIEFLPKLYSAEEVANRVVEIERATSTR